MKMHDVLRMLLPMVVFLIYFPGTDGRSLSTEQEEHRKILDKLLNSDHLSENDKLMVKYLDDNYPEYIEAVSGIAPLTPSQLNKIPAGFILVLPVERLFEFLENPVGSMNDYIWKYDDSGRALPIQLVSAASEEKSTFIRETSEGVLKKGLGEYMTKWWNSSIDALIFVNETNPNVLPFLSVSTINGINKDSHNITDLDSLSYRISLKRWNSGPLSSVCAWKDVISGRTDLLDSIYESLSDGADEDGPLAFFPCFSPRELREWIAVSSKVPNNKVPIIRAIQRHKELGLYPFQIRVLSDCIDWNDDDLKARKKVFRLLDVMDFDINDLRDLDEDSFKKYGASWDFTLKIKNLILESVDVAVSDPDALHTLGPFSVSLPWTFFAAQSSVGVDALDSIASPLIRPSQSRAIMQSNDYPDTSNPHLISGIPADKINKRSPPIVIDTHQLTNAQLWSLAKIYGKTHPNLWDWVPTVDPKQLSASVYLPKDLALSVFEKEWESLPSMSEILKNPLHPLSEALESSISGLSCAQLRMASVVDVVLLASYYNAHGLRSPKGEIKYFPLALRDCFKERLLEYLEFKSLGFKDVSADNIWNSLSHSDIAGLGGAVLSALEPREFNSIRDRDIQLALVEEVGKLTFPQLLPLFSLGELKTFADTALALFGGVQNLTSALKLGSLVYLAPEELSKNLHPLEIKTLLDSQRSKVACLPKNLRDSWIHVLIKAFAVTWSWKEWDMIHIGDLLINLDDSQLDFLNPSALRLALPQLISNSELFLEYSEFSGFKDKAKFSTVCDRWLGEEQDYHASFSKLMRLYLGASQYSVRVSERLEKKKRLPLSLRGSRNVKQELVKIHNSIRRDLQSLREGKTEEELEYIKTLLANLNDGKNLGIVQMIGESKEYSSDLYQTYLSSENPDERIIESIENLLIEAQKYIIREIKYFFRLNGSDILAQYDEGDFCSLIDCMDPLWCSMYECQTENNRKELDLNITCDGIIMAGKGVSSVALKEMDLLSWTKTQLLDCLDVLGSLELPKHQKKDIWNLLKQHVSLDDTIELFSLGNMLEMVELSKIDFSMENIDAISIAGSYPVSSPINPDLKRKVKAFLIQSIGNRDDLELKKAALSHLLCVLNENEEEEELVDELFPTTGDLSSFIVLRHIKECPNKHFRSSVATKILEYHGNSSSLLKPSDLASFGLFVSGLSPDIMRQIHPEAFEAIPRKGAMYFEPNHLEKVSIENLAHMRPETLSVFEDSHLPKNFALTLTELKNLKSVKNVPHGHGTEKPYVVRPSASRGLPSRRRPLFIILVSFIYAHIRFF